MSAGPQGIGELLDHECQHYNNFEELVIKEIATKRSGVRWSDQGEEESAC